MIMEEININGITITKFLYDLTIGVVYDREI